MSWWQDQNAPFIPPVQFSSEATLAALKAPLLVASILRPLSHIFQTISSSGRYIIIHFSETTAVNTACPHQFRLSAWQQCRYMGRHKASVRDIWWERSRYGSETLAKTDHSSHFLTFQQGEGCLPLDPEICHRSSTAILVQTQIDSVLIALIGSLRWQSCNTAVYSAAPTTGQLRFFSASIDAIFVVPVSLTLLTFCTAGRFQQCSTLALRYKGTGWPLGNGARCLSISEEWFDPDFHVLHTDQCSARERNWVCITGLDYIVYENLAFGD